MKIAWIAYLTSKTNQPPLTGRHPFFDVYPDPVESPQDSLDFITKALAKMQLKSCQDHTLAGLLDNLQEVASIDDLRSNTALPSKPRGKLAPVELS